MSSRSVIRSIQDSDLEWVLAINQANVPAVGSIDLDRLRFLVAESPIALVTTLDDEIAGFCLVLAPGSTYDSINYVWFMDRHPDAMYLDRVAFDERFHGLGLGRAMYTEVDRLMQDQFPHASSLCLEVNLEPPNAQSLAFHDRLGFERIGTQVAKGIVVSMMRRPHPTPTPPPDPR